MWSISILPEDIEYIRARIAKWGRQNISTFPWRNTSNRWHALTAEIMLQRTRAEQVLPVYESFASRYESPTDYLESDRIPLFSALGLAWREKQFLKLARVLSNTEVPSSKQELLQLPGVGEYIASAFLSLHMGVRETIIDSNVVRLYGRFFGFETDGETRRKKWFIELANRVTPAQKFKDFNYGVIDFTRTVCKAKPLCQVCILRKKCNYYSEYGGYTFRSKFRDNA